MSLLVLKPGALSTLQDMGRQGFQRFGVIASGAMDEWAHRAANLLVGNDGDQATLELTLIGPSLLFEQSVLVAITGADLSPRIDARAVPMHTPVLVRAGQRIDFGQRRSGCRAYLAVHGGFAVEPVMGSRSTYLRAGIGGFEGRALKKGDRLALAEPNQAGRYPGLRLALEVSGDAFVGFATSRFRPLEHPAFATQPRAAALARGATIEPGAEQAPARVRASPGQQWAAFSSEAQTRLFGEPYGVAVDSDRMGYRLQGPSLALRAPLEMISQAVAFGTVQVPPDGQPIVLMADRQTAGGYPKIAAVASVDLPILAQRLPRERVSFERIELAEAQALILQREREFDAIRESTEQLGQN